MLLLLLNGISALFGGYVLIDDPSGGGMQMPVDLMKTRPFKDYLIPGIYLFSVLGVGSLIVLFMVIAHARYSAQAVLLQGLATIAWIVTQMVVVHDIVLLQIIFLSVGAVLALCSLALHQRT